MTGLRGGWYPLPALALAGVVKLVDTLDSKSSGGNPMPVRLRQPGPARMPDVTMRELTWTPWRASFEGADGKSRVLLLLEKIRSKIEQSPWPAI